MLIYGLQTQNISKGISKTKKFQFGIRTKNNNEMIERGCGHGEVIQTQHPSKGLVNDAQAEKEVATEDTNHMP